MMHGQQNVKSEKNIFVVRDGVFVVYVEVPSNRVANRFGMQNMVLSQPENLCQIILRCG
jgi:hypothetical protein